MDSSAVRPPGETAASLILMNQQGSEVERWDIGGKNTYRLGRADGSDILLPFTWVSRQHAMIQVEENGVHNLIDLGSANGTTVNGRRIYTPTPLRSGDMIGIGKTQLVFLHDASVASGQTIDEAEFADNQTVAFVEKEVVTVLLCDIHGFTRLAEQLGDQQISKLLQIWSEEVTKLVRKYGGIVDKFIGDAVMAMWIGGKDQRSAILSAMQAAMAIKDATRVLGLNWPGNALTLEIGSALNTGEAVLGNMGGRGHRDYTVVGDMVNVAFRLEGMTSHENGIDLIVGHDTAAYLDDIDACFTSRTYTLKGKETPIEAFVCSFTQLGRYLERYVGAA